MRQYLDLLQLILDEGVGEERPHRHRHAQRLRPPDALRPRRGLPAGHHEEGPHPLGVRRAAVVPARRHQREVAPGPRRHDLGRVGRRRTATSGRSTATSGAPGRPPTAGTSTRSRRSSSRSDATPTAAATSSAPGTSPTSRRWRSRPATRCSSSTSPADGPGLLAASSTSAAPTCSSACRSTSRPTPCSPTWSPRSPGSRSATSCTRSATPTSTPTTSSRPGSSSPATRARCPTLTLDPSVTELDAFDLEHIESRATTRTPASRHPIAV